MNNNIFIPQYSSNFLQWALISVNLCISIKVRENDKIVGFIAAKIIENQVNKDKIQIAEINLLCVHPKLRGKQMTNTLIKELTRLINLYGYNDKAMYISEHSLPNLFAKSRLFHRALNIDNLLKVSFLNMEGKVTVDQIKREIKLPITPSNKNFIPIQEHHLKGAYNCLNEYFSRYNCHPIFTFEEFSKIFFNNDIVTCYILTDKNNNVTDFISYYYIQLKIIKNNKVSFINTANLYYYTTLTESAYRLIRDILIIAQNKEIDVFNAFDIMENMYVLKELCFEPSKRVINYYFYNLNIRYLNNNQIGKIMLL